MESGFEEQHNHHPEMTHEASGEEADYIAQAEEGWDKEDQSEGTEILGLAPHGHRAVLQARSQRGVRESGGPNNGIPLERYVRYFLRGSGPLPWCAFFVSWAFDTTGDKDHRTLWSNPGYVGSIHGWAKANGRLVKTPQHGDIFGVGTEHTGLVAGADPAASLIWTIEGNFGDAVAQRNIQYRTYPLWFARMG